MQSPDVRLLINTALEAGHGALSEYDSKRVLAGYGVPVTRETLVDTAVAAVAAAEALGYPVVLKGCAPNLKRKTEAGLVVVGLASGQDVTDAFDTLSGRAGHGFKGGYLVQETVRGSRELMIRMTRDDQMTPSVTFGIGGIYTEVLDDVSVRSAPLSLADAHDMMDEIRAARILDAVRGMARVDRAALARVIICVSEAAIANPEIAEIDINPLIINGSKPVAADGLIVLKAAAQSAGDTK